MILPKLTLTKDDYLCAIGERVHMQRRIVCTCIFNSNNTMMETTAIGFGGIYPSWANIMIYLLYEASIVIGGRANMLTKTLKGVGM